MYPRRSIWFASLLLLHGGVPERALAQVSVDRHGEKENSVLLESNGRVSAHFPLSDRAFEGQTTSDRGVGQLDLSPVSSYNWALRFSRSGKVFKDVSFADPETGYLVTELGAVYKTSNGGDTWVTKLDLGFPYYWYGVETLSQDTVVISGFNNQADFHEGVVRWSFDGGDSWEKEIVLIVPDGVGWLDRVHFFNSDTGVVMASFSGGAHYTTTGGKDSASWTYVQINQDLGWFAGNIDAMESGNLFATGIHRAQSSDFGLSWTSMPSADPTFDGGIDFLDDDLLLGWTGGGQISPTVEGWAHRTTDGGETWSSRLFSFAYPVRAVKFWTDTSGLGVGGNVFSESGGIYATTDGGTTWELDLNTGAEMFSLEIIRVSSDSIDVWCAGSTGGSTGFIGKLYKARIYYQSVSTSMNPDENRAPATFRLFQNYPNPFNPNTSISFRLPARSLIRLTVHSLLGQEISLLLSEKLEAGFQVVEFDGTQLSSGTYFYRLETDEGTLVKKMVLLR
jgi:photosystem II stability/assembly factor-like uncharacterized protein